MEKYSHGPFQVTGYKVSILNQAEEKTVISATWHKFMSEKIEDSIQYKEHESLHTIYFNIKNPEDLTIKSYDMLIGCITKENAKQTNPELITIVIPAQDYMYTVIKEGLPGSLVFKWMEINNMTKAELPRVFGYDMDMYNVEGTEVTIAVSVK